MNGCLSPQSSRRFKPLRKLPRYPFEKIAVDNFVDGNRRVTFAELVRAGFLKQGDENYCRTLKRQQRAGSEAFIKAAIVTENGTVDFLSRRFSNPSKLAVAMVNANGGEAKALNGYDYLFVQSPRDREANAPGTRLAIAELLAPHRERLSALFDKTLDVIEDALEAHKSFLVRGVIVDAGPDHYARIAAGIRFFGCFVRQGEER